MINDNSHIFCFYSFQIVNNSNKVFWNPQRGIHEHQILGSCMS